MSTIQQVSRYLRSHSSACDTAEGIARWWLDAGDPARLAVVEAALAWLAQRGAVAVVPAADGRVRYRRQPGAQADAVLNELSRSPGDQLH